MSDRRQLGRIVLLIGVLLVALPSAIGFLSGSDVDRTLGLTLSITGMIATVMGMVLYYLANRSAS